MSRWKTKFKMPLAQRRLISKDTSRDVMNMKIPSNPKYQHIKSSLDTGASMSRYMKKIEEIRRNYRYRKDEIFKRMKISTFVQLVIKIAEYNNAAKQQVTDENSAADGKITPITDRQIANISPSVSLALSDGDFGEDPVNTARSTLESVSRGIGEMDLNTPDPAAGYHTFPTNTPECPYLLLDVRDQDCFSQCHIITAVNFPIAMLSRSVNGEIAEMLQYKNKPGKVILLYDEDERIGVRAATTLAERGYDNLFLLSGGLKLASRFYTDGFITGTLPISCTNETSNEIKLATQDEFTEHDIEKLELLLDNALQDHSIGGTTRPNSGPILPRFS